MISRCNIYLGIPVVEDSQKNAVDIVFPKNKIYSVKRRVCPDFEKLHKKFIYNNASEKFIPLSDLGSLLQHFFPEITISLKYLLLSSVVFEKINNLDFFSKFFFSIGRNWLPEAKLGGYVVHIIDYLKRGLFEKTHFQIFQKNRRHFLNF